jgi:hypothetical protein
VVAQKYFHFLEKRKVSFDKTLKKQLVTVGAYCVSGQSDYATDERGIYEYQKRPFMVLSFWFSLKY